MGNNFLLYPPHLDENKDIDTVLHINIKLSPHVFRTIFNMDVLEAYNALKSAERYFEVWMSK